MWDWVLRLSGLAAAVYLGLAAYLWAMQGRLLYYPELGGRGLAASPADIGLDYEALWLSAADGVRLHGWYVPAPRARGAVLFLHGNAGNIAHRLESIRIFHQLGLAVLIFDYRGYGRSEGRPTEQGTYRDAQAAWDHLVRERGLAAGRILIFGRSLGASIGARLAARVRPRALIVESAFTSVPDLAAQLYPWLPVRLLSRYRYDTAAALAGLRCPVLVVHSRDDEIIPYSHGRALFERANPPKRLLTLRGGHNDGFLVTPDYVPALGAFVDSVLGPAGA